MNFTCPFCDKRCFKPYLHAECWDCLECKSRFWETSKGLKISLITRIKGEKYRLDIDNNLNKTELFHVIEHPQTIWEDEDKLLIKLTYVLEKVNPSNVNNKVKIMLTFL